MKNPDEKLRPAKFTVDLGGVRLPNEVARKIDRDIRRSVLSAIAEVDFDGEIGVKLPPDLWGIIIDPRRFELRSRG
jgi:hypothetical protein